MKISNVIIEPMLTEKTTAQKDVGRYVFKVSLSSSKGSIAKEVKRIYGVDVISVNTNITAGKFKRIGRTKNFSQATKWKKAVVALKEGQKIEVLPKSE